MGDSQENNKGKSRDKDNYVSWTMEDTNELLHLLVDVSSWGHMQCTKGIKPKSA